MSSGLALSCPLQDIDIMSKLRKMADAPQGIEKETEEMILGKGRRWASVRWHLISRVDSGDRIVYTYMTVGIKGS